MSSIDRNKIRRMILKEFKMIGMTDMGHGHSAMKSSKSCVSREDCCAAIMCLVECCECPITKRTIMECCQDIMAGAYDHK